MHWLDIVLGQTLSQSLNRPGRKQNGVTEAELALTELKPGYLSDLQRKQD